MPGPAAAAAAGYTVRSARQPEDNLNTAIITGASVGIGSAAARAFVDEGFNVFNLSRRQCPVEGVTNIACDLSDAASVGAACEQLRGPVEQSSSVALVHNASQMLKDSADHCASNDLRQVLETNVIGLNSLNQHLLSLLPATSSVLYVGSTLSEKAVGGSFSYVVTHLPADRVSGDSWRIGRYSGAVVNHHHRPRSYNQLRQRALIPPDPD